MKYFPASPNTPTIRDNEHYTRLSTSWLNRDLRSTPRAKWSCGACSTLATISRHHLLLNNGRNLGARSRNTVLRGRLNCIVWLRRAMHGCYGLWFLNSAGFSIRLSVDVYDRWWCTSSTALNTIDNQENPEDELQDGADGNAGDASIPFTNITVAVVSVVSVVVGTADAGAPGADKAAAEDEEEDGGTEATDGPPFGDWCFACDRLRAGHNLRTRILVCHFGSSDDVMCEWILLIRQIKVIRAVVKGILKQYKARLFRWAARLEDLKNRTREKKQTVMGPKRKEGNLSTFPEVHLHHKASRSFVASSC